MEIHNVVSIHDNGEFITIETQTGSVIHLPTNAGHSITVMGIEDPSMDHITNISIDLYQD